MRGGLASKTEKCENMVDAAKRPTTVESECEHTMVFRSMFCDDQRRCVRPQLRPCDKMMKVTAYGFLLQATRFKSLEKTKTDRKMLAHACADTQCENACRRQDRPTSHRTTSGGSLLSPPSRDLRCLLGVAFCG